MVHRFALEVQNEAVLEIGSSRHGRSISQSWDLVRGRPNVDQNSAAVDQWYRRPKVALPLGDRLRQNRQFPWDIGSTTQAPSSPTTGRCPRCAPATDQARVNPRFHRHHAGQRFRWWRPSDSRRLVNLQPNPVAR